VAAAWRLARTVGLVSRHPVSNPAGPAGARELSLRWTAPLLMLAVVVIGMCAASTTTVVSRAGSSERPARLHSVLMDRFVGQARLEWWANQSTCLGTYDIAITVTVDADGEWWATGRQATALHATERESWDFLLEMDPHFSLAFPGEDCGGIMVRVVETDDGTLTLVKAPEWGGSGSVTFDLT
ncbi:hypothetical protein GA0115253_102288, partial [Streptomyces sp. Termitarium-T10T-6]